MKGRRGVILQYRAVLLDFDGTLVDTSEGIFHSIAVAFRKMGMPLPPKEILRHFMGPPIYYSFQTFAGMDAQQAELATQFFRVDYEEDGVYRSKPYDGLPELLRRLREENIKIGVATLKPEKMAKLLLSRFGISDLVDVCVGSRSDEMDSATKAQIIDRVLEQLGEISKQDAVLIGDTKYDREGPQQAGVDFIAAAYGYGVGPEEEAASVFVARDTEALLTFFFPIEL